VKLLVESSSTFADDVPLLIVSVRMSVVPPVPENVLLAAPVNVIPAPALLALVLKSERAVVREVAAQRQHVIGTVPEAADWNVPPAAIVTSPPTVSVRAVVTEYCEHAGDALAPRSGSGRPRR
jgi:hypothetical protein